MKETGYFNKKTGNLEKPLIIEQAQTEKQISKNSAISLTFYGDPWHYIFNNSCHFVSHNLAITKHKIPCFSTA